MGRIGPPRALANMSLIKTHKSLSCRRWGLSSEIIGDYIVHSLDLERSYSPIRITFWHLRHVGLSEHSIRVFTAVSNSLDTAVL